MELASVLCLPALKQIVSFGKSLKRFWVKGNRMLFSASNFSSVSCNHIIVSTKAVSMLSFHRISLQASLK